MIMIFGSALTITKEVPAKFMRESSSITAAPEIGRIPQLTNALRWRCCPHICAVLCTLLCPVYFYMDMVQI